MKKEITKSVVLTISRKELIKLIEKEFNVTMPEKIYISYEAKDNPAIVTTMNFSYMESKEIV